MPGGSDTRARLLALPLSGPWCPEGLTAGWQRPACMTQMEREQRSRKTRRERGGAAGAGSAPGAPCTCSTPSSSWACSAGLATVAVVTANVGCRGTGAVARARVTPRAGRGMSGRLASQAACTAARYGRGASLPKHQPHAADGAVARLGVVHALAQAAQAAQHQGGVAAKHACRGGGRARPLARRRPAGRGPTAAGRHEARPGAPLCAALFVHSVSQRTAPAHPCMRAPRRPQRT